MKLLLHSCCGPCTVGSLPLLRAAGYDDIFGYFYNPNIHPFTEHKARRQAFAALMEAEKMPYLALKDYPLEQWLAQVASDPQQRCAYCYESRLRAAAAYGVEHGFEMYTTTLLISPYQNHELIRSLGQDIGSELGIGFAYVDLRPGFRAGQDAAREMGLYMQKYCGCIYSEKERYCRKKRIPREENK